MRHTTFLLLFVLASSARAVTITVTTTNDSGPGSLRQAIIDANTNADLDSIMFGIPGAGVQTISPTNQLPAITNSVVLDGYTQPFSEPNDLVNGNDAELRIRLDGSNAGQASGLILSTSNSVVRGLVINGFHTPCCGGFGYGIRVTGSDNIIEGNFIGTDADGDVVVGNGNTGVSIVGAGNTIGGTLPKARNVISGNGAFGVDICCSASSSNNNILNNYIGTDADGANFLGNGNSGVRIAYAPNNVVKGTNVIAGSGTLVGAVEIAEQGASGTLIQGNFIGVAADGETGFTNANYFGVDFSNEASSNFVGGTVSGAGNVIAFSSHAGVMVGGSNTTFGIERGNAVLGNSIFANGGLGIDLGEITAASGVTTNDVCDTDDGVNHLQNFPVLTLATNTVGGIRIDGFLDSVPSQTYRLEFFDNAACDPSGFGEGETFIGYANIIAGAGCTNAFSVTFTNTVSDCHFVTATATDPDNNTSEFSACEVVRGNLPVVCTLTPQLATNFVGATHILTNQVTRNGQPMAGVIVYSRITAGPNAGLSAVATNDNNGLAEFSYTSTTNGTDTITVTGRVCAVDFQCTATKVWLAPIQADLRLTKIDSPDPVMTGSNLTYTITITNAGPDTASSVSVTDNLPASTTFSTCNAPNGGTCGGSGNNRTVAYASLPAGQSRTITFVTTVNCTVANGTLISNTATVNSSAVDPNGANNFATATTTATNPPPTIVCPADVVSATGGSNVVVVFNSPSVVDNCSGTVVVAVPLSGSTFNPGTNPVVCTATDAGGATNSCTFSVIVPEATPGLQDLAVTKLSVPKSVRLKGGHSAVNKRVTVTIQNLSPHDEVIRHYSNLLNIAGTSLGDCPALVLTLINGKPNKDLPFTLKAKRTMKLSYTVTFSCANDPAKGKGHEDFSFTATVNHASIDGNADTVPANDTCPRPPNPAIKDKGCGAKSSSHALGAAVLTDVSAK